MCKIIFQILLSMTISFQLFAQTRPTKSLAIGNLWKYEQSGWTHGFGRHSCSFAYQATKDTLIENNIFYRSDRIMYDAYSGYGVNVWSNYYERANSIRVEATIGGGYPPEVIYDFSMDIGDTLFNPMLYPDPGYTRYVTTIAKGDTILWGENLAYLKIISLSNLYGNWGPSTIIAVEKFGVVSIYYRGVDEGYTRRLTGAIINDVAYGDTTTVTWVKSTYPSNNSYDSELSPEIVISFSEPIDPATTNKFNVFVYADQSGARSIDSLNYDPETQTMVFTLDRPLGTSEDVNVAIKPLRNTFGKWMPSSHAFHFKTRTTDGTGIFSKSEEIVLPQNPTTLASGDFDLDGDLDLIATYGQFSIVLAKNYLEKGFFLAPPQDFQGEYPVLDLLPLDFDLNGDLGVIITDGIYSSTIEQKNIGSGILNQQQPIDRSLKILSFSSGDIDGDGILDLIAKRDYPEIWFFKNPYRNGTFLWSNDYIALDEIPYSVVIGDWNNDSSIDLAVTQPASAKLLIYMNNKKGQFSLKDTVNSIVAVNTMITGDIDGDADIDLVLSNGIVLINSGKGMFIHGVPVNMNFQKIEFGDVDGDIDLDVVGITENSLLVFKNNGTGVFSMFSKLDLENRPNSLVMGDWDNDGDLDVAIAYDESNIISIFKNDFTPPEQPRFVLEQNFPNPCSKSTYFYYTLPENMNVTLSIYNINGESVVRLFSGYQEVGKHLISWPPGSVSSGIYFFQIRTSKGTKNIKFSVVK